MRRLSDILTAMVMVICIGINIADASGIVPCGGDERGAVPVSSIAQMPGHVPAPAVPSRSDGRIPRSHCSVVPPFAAAIPCARIAVAQPQPDHRGIVPQTDEHWFGRTPPPLLAPPRRVA